jgi:hypothetical protein
MFDPGTSLDGIVLSQTSMKHSHNQSDELPPRKLVQPASSNWARPSIMDDGGRGNMPKRIYSTEQIIGKLREAEALLSQGQTVG